MRGCLHVHRKTWQDGAVTCLDCGEYVKKPRGPFEWEWVALGAVAVMFAAVVTVLLLG